MRLLGDARSTTCMCAEALAANVARMMVAKGTNLEHRNDASKLADELDVSIVPPIRG